MTAIEELLRRNRTGDRPDDAIEPTATPSLKVAIVACMDVRLDVYAALGLRQGEAHVIRNAGGVVTDDVLRSLIVSQRLLGTEEIMLIHHTRCGMMGLDETELTKQVTADAGSPPPFGFEAFADVEESVRSSKARIEASPFVQRKGAIRGFVYDVDTGRLNEVS